MQLLYSPEEFDHYQLLPVAAGDDLYQHPGDGGSWFLIDVSYNSTGTVIPSPYNLTLNNFIDEIYNIRSHAIITRTNGVNLRYMIMTRHLFITWKPRKFRANLQQ